MVKIDVLSDYHMHSNFSDGSASIDEMARSAIEKGLSQITVTDHMPFPEDLRYTMKKDMVDLYKLTVNELQQRYAGKLRINTGIEIEYRPELKFWVNSISQMGWDHAIASVHSLFVGDTHTLVNGTAEEFDVLYRLFDGDIKALCRTYYHAARALYKAGWCNIAGHLDVVKKHNADYKFFDDSEPWYRTLVMDTLEVVKEKQMTMEVNTAGFNHPVQEQYPARWIIQAALKKGIPLVLSSDAHCPDTLGQNFDRIHDMVSEPSACAV